MIAVLARCGSSSKIETSKKATKVVLVDTGWDSIKFHNAVVSFVVSFVAKNGYGLYSEIMTASTPISHTYIIRGDATLSALS